MTLNIPRNRRVGAAALAVVSAGALSVSSLAITGGAAVATPAHSAAIAAGHARSAKREQTITAMTYNILELSNDGRLEGGERVAPWSKRGPKAAALVRQIHPDVLGVEEGASYVPGSKTVIQSASLRNYIGGTYRLAHTEIPPRHPHFFRTGVNIIYNNATVKPVGKGNHFDTGNTRWVAYQEFMVRATHAKFLFAATHLLIGYGHADDVAREAETNKMIKVAGGIASKRHIPVIYAGDFNSANPKDHKFTFNGAGRAMSAHHNKDALAIAPKRTNAKYDSANENQRKPPKFAAWIDHIYAPKGVSVRSAGLVLDLRHGKFVGAIPSDHNPLWATLSFAY